ncbi:MAG: sigma-70 family RNA polymerase sigma factor [Verrucomicrobiota bacterium]
MNAILPEAEDPALLRDYVEHASERAFAELVRRHLPHVYAGALRRVNGDRALAADVAQTVFADFARKAPGLTHLTVPGGWLHRHAGFVAGKLIDKERRRRRREQEAAAMNTPAEYEGDPVWAATAPLLDAALDTLPRPDRDAIVLRFFEHRDFHAVGAALGISDDTAQKRVSRALEKLRAVLTGRGTATAGVTAAALPALLLNFAAPPAPAALAAAVPGKALALAAAQPAGWLAAFHRASGWRKTAAGFAAAAALAAVPLTLQHRRLLTADSENDRLARQAAPATPDAIPSPAAGNAAKPPAPDIPDLIAQAAAALRGGKQDVSAVAAALGLLARVSPDNMQEALARVREVTDEPARALLYKYLLSFWAESNPGMALAFAYNEVPAEQRASVCEGVLTAWASQNPESLMGWRSKSGALAPPPVEDSLMATVFRTLSSRNPATAFQLLERPQSGNSRAQALRGIMDTVRTDADRTRMLGLIDNCQDSEIRLQARRAVVEHWAQRDPAAAAAWVDAAQPAWERTRLMDSLGYAWLQSDPASAADWWLQRAPGPDTLVKIINVWAQEDPNAAGTWLSRQTPGPQSDTARMTFARQVADLDPASALRWAETVTDPAQRETTIDHIWQTWRARDATEAGAFLSTANWPPDRLARLDATK